MRNSIKILLLLVITTSLSGLAYSRVDLKYEDDYFSSEQRFWLVPLEKSLKEKYTNTVLIAIGISALEEGVRSNKYDYILALDVYRREYEHVLVDGPESLKSKIAIIYRDPHPKRQLCLASILGPTRTFLYPYHYEPPYDDIITPDNISLDMKYIEDFNMKEVIRNSKGKSGIIVSSNTNIGSPASWRALVRSSYRQSKMLFAHKISLVKSGALATTYVQRKDLIPQVLKVLDSIEKGVLPEPSYHDDYSVFINERLASFYQVDHLTNEALKARVAVCAGDADDE